MNEEEFYQLSIETINNATESDGPVLVDALPALGKTTNMIEWAAETGEPTTIYTERHALYEQIKQGCDDRGLTWSVLPSYHYHCPTGGKHHKHGDDWKKAVAKKLNEGYSARKIHEDATTLFGEELPCQAEGPCEYIQAFEKESDGADVFVGHYTHLLRSETYKDRYVFIDEFPGDSLLIEFSSDDRNDAITNYLWKTDELPWNHINELNGYLPHKSEGDTHADEDKIRAWLNGPEGTSFKSTKWHVKEYNPRRAAFAPHLLRAMLTEQELGQGSPLRLSRLPDGTLVVRESNNGVKIRPPLAKEETKRVEGSEVVIKPESVVGLDGTPSFLMWKAILGEDLESRPVLNDTEKHEWLRCLGLEFIQITRRTEPCLGNRSKPKEDYALIKAVEEREGQMPFIVGSKDEIEKLVNLDSSLADRSTHYGNLKGLNEYGNEEVALLLGSPQLNDDTIALWAAFNGEPAVPATNENGNRLRGTQLDYGEPGNEILYGTRDNEVVQAGMRFSREPSDSTTRVYVYTSAIPEWVQPTKCFVTHRMWEQNGLKQVIRAFTDGTEWEHAGRTTREIADRVSELFSDDAIGMDMVRKHLKRLDEEMGLIRCTRSGRSYVWENIGLEQRPDYGVVVFSDYDS